MKIYYRGRYVKNVPAKYAVIPDLPDFFEDIDSPRLSVAEIGILDMALFATKLQPFLERFKEKSPMDYWMIEKSSPHFAHEVTTTDDQVYYSLLFRNGFPIRIPKKIYDQCPRQGRVKYPNSFVAAPALEQLKLSFS